VGEYRILVADELGAAGLELLEAAADIRVDVDTDRSRSELLGVIGRYDGLIMRSATTVDAELIAAAERLAVVGRAGVGVDNIDVDAATRKGVIVMNTPQANAIATAEQTMALMLAASRHTAHAHASVAAQEWSRAGFTGVELAGRTLGIIGFGRIGREVARRARAFRMEVVAYDPYVSELVARDQSITLVELEELLGRSDVLTLHCALSPSTEHILDAAALATLKPGAIVINAARGGLVDETALADALRSGHVHAAGVDVFSSAPPGSDNPLIGLPNVVHTPHLGASTREAQRDVAVQIADQVIAALRSDEIRNSINFPFELDAELKPWLELAHALGRLQFAMAPERIEIEARGDSVKESIRAVATGVLAGLLSGFLPDSVNLVNAPALAAEHGIAISESHGIGAPDFANLISCRVVWAGGERDMSGSAFENRQGRIVQVSRTTSMPSLAASFCSCSAATCQASSARSARCSATTASTSRSGALDGTSWVDRRSPSSTSTRRPARRRSRSFARYRQWPRPWWWSSSPRRWPRPANRATLRLL
jgi:D-3-phosphoglycerate dehydrogenase